MRWLKPISRGTAFAILLMSVVHWLIGFSLMRWPSGQLARTFGKVDPDPVTAGELTAEKGMELIVTSMLLLVVAAAVRLAALLAEKWLPGGLNDEVQGR